MNLESCDVLRTISDVDSVRKFRLILEELDENAIRLLFECLYNLPLNATTREEKALLKKYKKVFALTHKRQFTLQAAEAYLALRVVKQTVTLVIQSLLC